MGVPTPVIRERPRHGFALVTLLAVAGCLGGVGGAGPSSDQTPETTVAPEVTPEGGLPYAAANDSKNVDDPRAIYLENHQRQNRTLTVAVRRVEGVYCEHDDSCASTSETIFRVRYELEATIERTIPDVIAAEGTYEVTVRTDTGHTETFEWRVSDAHHWLAVSISESGELSITQAVE